MVLVKNPGLPCRTGHTRGQCPRCCQPGPDSCPAPQSCSLPPCSRCSGRPVGHVRRFGPVLCHHRGHPCYRAAQTQLAVPCHGSALGIRALPPAGLGTLGVHSRQAIDTVDVNLVGEAWVNWPKNKFKIEIPAFFCLVEEYCFSLFASWGGNLRRTQCLQGGREGEAKPRSRVAGGHVWLPAFKFLNLIIEHKIKTRFCSGTGHRAGTQQPHMAAVSDTTGAAGPPFRNVEARGSCR